MNTGIDILNWSKKMLTNYDVRMRVIQILGE